MASIFDVFGRLLLDDSKFQADAAKSAQATGDKYGGTMGARVTSGMTKAFTVAGGAGGALFTGAVAGATRFEEQLRTVNTVAKLPDATLKSLGDQVIALSKETGKSTDDLTAGLYDLVSAGVPADQAISVLRDSAVFATGALGTTGEAVDVVTSALNAYGLSADQSTRVTDVFAQAVADGKVTASELGSSIANIAPIASSAGVSLEEVSTGFAVLTAKGTPAAQAATQMRAAISALLTPNQALNDLQKETGVNFAELAKTQGLQAALQALSDATGGNAEAMGKALGSVEAYQFALAATGENADSFTTELAKVQEASQKGGVAQEQYAEIQKSAAAQGRKFTAAIAALGLQIGGPFTESIGPAVTALGGMGTGLSGIFNLSKLVGGGLGALGGNLLGKLLPAITGLLPAVAPAVTALGGGIAALIPVGMAALPVLLVGALVAAVIFLANNPEIVDQIISFAEGAVQWIVDGFGKLVEALPGIVGKALELVVGLILNLPGLIADLVPKIVGLWLRINQRIVQLVLDLAGKIVGFVLSIPGRLVELVPKLVALWISFSAQARAKIIAFVGQVVGFILSIPGKVASWVGSIAGQAGQLAARLGSIISTLVGRLVGFFLSIPGRIASLGGKLVGAIINGMASLPGRIADVIRKAFANLRIDIGPFHISASGVQIDIPKIDLPHFAAGGLITAGTAAVIGEEGPELFVPQVAGTILPAGSFERATVARPGGGDTWQIQVPVTGFLAARTPADVVRPLHQLAAAGVLRSPRKRHQVQLPTRGGQRA